MWNKLREAKRHRQTQTDTDRNMLLINTTPEINTYEKLWFSLSAKQYSTAILSENLAEDFFCLFAGICMLLPPCFGANISAPAEYRSDCKLNPSLCLQIRISFSLKLQNRRNGFEVFKIIQTKSISEAIVWLFVFFFWRSSIHSISQLILIFFMKYLTI